MIHYLERVIWKILYPAIKEANLVRDCLPEPPTPTRRALPQGVRIIRDIWIDKQRQTFVMTTYRVCFVWWTNTLALTRWTIASLKNTRSKCAPLTVSLYIDMYWPSFSFRKSSVGTCHREEFGKCWINTREFKSRNYSTKKLMNSTSSVVHHLIDFGSF